MKKSRRFIIFFIVAFTTFLPEILTMENNTTEEILKKIRSGSWMEIKNKGEKTIDQLLNHFQTTYFLSKYYYEKYPKIMKKFEKIKKNKLKLIDNEFVDDLDLIEIMRIHSIFNKYKMFNNKNFENDDVVRARALSGYFCRKEKIKDDNSEESEEEENKKCEPFGSGMLRPGQSHKNKFYSVLTALHIFSKEELENLYFIPYGYPGEIKYAFKVKEIYRYLDPKEKNDTYKIVDEEFLKEYSKKEDSKFPADSIIDMSVVHINKKTITGNTLPNLLAEREIDWHSEENEEITTTFENIWFKKNDEKLPNLIGYQNEPKNPVVFAIGMASNPKIGIEEYLSQKFAISINLFMPYSEKKQFSSLTKVKTHYGDLKTGKLDSLLWGEFISDFPAYFGMSGGPVLSCSLKENKKKCRFIGTIRGSAVTFEDENKPIGWNAIVNSIRLKK